MPAGNSNPADSLPEVSELATCDEAQLARYLDTNLKDGLSDAAANSKLDMYGANQLKQPPKPTLLMLFVVQLTNLIIMLLIGAAVASFIVNGTGDKNDDILSYIEGIAIFVIVILNAGIAAVTENSANDALEKLSKMTAPDSTLMRSGKEIKIKTTQIVPGDLVILNVGDVVPADMRMLFAADLKVSEMPLTGEPDDVLKKAQVPKKGNKEGGEEKLRPENCAYSGCNVTSGTGRGIVLRTGMTTEVGKIAGMLNDGDEGDKTTCFGLLPDTTGNMTPLQESLQRLGVRIGFMAIGVCVVVFIVGLLRSTKDPEDQAKPTWLYMILISVTLAVAAIPEGIPLCVTISLSFGSTEMEKKAVLVRKLAAVETLGSASIICTDKTGTLTEGKMRTVKMWCGQEYYDIDGSGFDPTSGKVKEKGTGKEATKDPAVNTNLLAALLCSNARIELIDNVWTPKGNSSEAPIVVAAQKIGLTPDEGEKLCPRMFEVPFSSARKMMLTAVDCSRQNTLGAGLNLPEGSKVLVCVKGAPDRVLKVCTHWAKRDGSTEELTQGDRDQVMSANNSFASEALRVLAIAVCPLQDLGFDAKDEDIGAEERLERLCKNLTFVGLVANFDPPRKGVETAVLQAQGGHIRVIMITGDYLKTAVAIAKNINILHKSDDESKAVDCGKLRPDGKNYISDSEMDMLTKKMCVFARAQPEDKLQIVKSLQRQGKVSAMTGDGVNDAPALNAAEIGVAMGIQGTEVAKGASDMILTDDNFCNIVAAVEKGRVIYAGIQKFVAFIMSVHIAEVMQIFFCVCVEFPLMREPVQILFLILVTDLPPSVALGMEPGQEGILTEWPRPRNQNIVLMWMWMSIVMNGAILSLVIILVFVWGLNNYVGETNALAIAAKIAEQNEEGVAFEDSVALDLVRARTVAFISLVWSENVRAYVSRSFDRPVWVELFANQKMQIAIGMAQVALYLAIFIPGLSDTILKLRGTEIGWYGWVAAFFGAVGCLVLCELFKIISGYQKKKFDEEERRIAEEEEAKRDAMIQADAKANAAKVETEKAQMQAAAPKPEVQIMPAEPIKQVNNSSGNNNSSKKDGFDSVVVTADPMGYSTKGSGAGLCCPMGAFW